MQKSLIAYISAIIVVLTVAFFSQNTSAWNFVKNILSSIEKNAAASLVGGLNFNSASNSSSSNAAKGSDNSKNLIGTDSQPPRISSFTSNKNIPSTQLIDTTFNPLNYINKGLEAISGIPVILSGSIKSGGQAITNQIDNAQKNISDTGKNISNYFSGIENAIVNPGQNNDCATQSSQTSAGQ